MRLLKEIFDVLEEILLDYLLPVYRALSRVCRAIPLPYFISRKQFEAAVSKRAAETCEKIAVQIGAELHDDLMQKLSSFQMHIPRVERSCSDDEGIIKMKVDFEQVLNAAKRITRRVLFDRSKDDTLVEMLDKVCRNLDGPYTGHIRFTSVGRVVKLPEDVEKHIIRIVQELIQNAFKHSSAWKISVRLKWETSMLSIEVEDDGSGGARVKEFVDRLKSRVNTLRIRSEAIGATIEYAQANGGLLARLTLKLPQTE